MNWSNLHLRLRALLFRQRVEDELDEELRFHIAMETRKNLATGMRAADAKRKVNIQFGGLEQVKEECREMRGLRFIENVAQDVRYALLGFRRTPGFALTVVATIALGLGLNTALFTVFNAYVLRPLNVPDPYRLYQFTWVNRNGEEHQFSWKEFQNFREQNPAFSEVTATSRLSQARVEGHMMLGQLVTGNYFHMLGVSAARGRTLLPEDAEFPGSASVAVLSSETWANKFGRDPNIIGKHIVIHGHTVEVVGVVQTGFRGVDELPLDFWVPLTLAPELEQEASLFGSKQPERLTVVGRLRHDITLNQAQSALTVWMQLHSSDRSDAERATRAVLRSKATIIPLDPMLVAAASPVMMAFGLVLLLACANVSNMMLARAMARQREIGIRMALGAGRTRLIQQLLTESMVLALLAAGAGFVISQESIRWGQWLLFTTMPGSSRELLTLIPALEPDARVFCFTLVAGILSALIFGLVPAIQSTRSNVMQAARGEFTTDFRPVRLRDALVIGQVTASVSLLICAAVLLRANNRMQRLDVGLQTKGVLALNIQDRFRAKTIQQITAEPGVQTIAAASKLPFMGSLRRITVVADHRSEPLAGYLYASPEYFQVFRVPILRGRNFTQDEATAGGPVAIISQATAVRLWPGQDALGQSLSIEPNSQQPPSLADPRAKVQTHSPVLIIGIARDVQNGWIGDGQDQTCVYFPTTSLRAGSILFARVNGDADVARRNIDATLAASVPGAVDQILPMVLPMDELRAAQLYPFRALYWISSAVGGLALLMTLSGIYGVLSYVVTQRTKEIGIRVALGARPGAVAGLVLKQSLRFAIVGAGIGSIGALGIIRMMASQIDMRMFGSFDGVAFGTVLLLVIAASAAAAWLPSRRAARIEPAFTLRCD
jgi:predicted permease